MALEKVAGSSPVGHPLVFRVARVGEFLQEHSNFGTASTIKDTLRRRLLNLVERGLVHRGGTTYVIDRRGIDYATTSDKAENGGGRAVLDAIKAYNDAQRERLNVMHPYRFQQLVRELLEAMGYEDVTVTQQSGDKGVDVVATVQFGITTVTEVVQVKRRRSEKSLAIPLLPSLTALRTRTSRRSRPGVSAKKPKWRTSVTRRNPCGSSPPRTSSTTLAPSSRTSARRARWCGAASPTARRARSDITGPWWTRSRRWADRVGSSKSWIVC